MRYLCHSERVTSKPETIALKMRTEHSGVIGKRSPAVALFDLSSFTHKAPGAAVGMFLRFFRFGVLALEVGERYVQQRARGGCEWCSQTRPPHAACQYRCSGRCTCSWHSQHRVIRFSSTSSPDRLRNFLWCTSRLHIAPHNWHRHPSRCKTCLRSWAKGSASRRIGGDFLRVALIMHGQHPGTPSSVCSEVV
jgi:hypothetical protein